MQQGETQTQHFQKTLFQVLKQRLLVLILFTKVLLLPTLNIF